MFPVIRFLTNSVLTFRSSLLSKNIGWSVSPDNEIKMAIVRLSFSLPFEIFDTSGVWTEYDPVKRTLVEIPYFVGLIIRQDWSQSHSLLFDFIVCKWFPIWTNSFPPHTTICLKSLPPILTELHLFYIRAIPEEDSLLNTKAFYTGLFETLQTVLGELSIKLRIKLVFESDDVVRFIFCASVRFMHIFGRFPCPFLFDRRAFCWSFYPNARKNGRHTC